MIKHRQNTLSTKKKNKEKQDLMTIQTGKALPPWDDFCLVKPQAYFCNKLYFRFFVSYAFAHSVS